MVRQERLALVRETLATILPPPPTRPILMVTMPTTTATMPTASGQAWPVRRAMLRLDLQTTRLRVQAERLRVDMDKQELGQGTTEGCRGETDANTGGRARSKQTLH